ncbi:MAG: hypothetical protein JXX14_08905 [Deltaproteobacteria bacterium]|nr:hypothetical protein [Deltaproteobacteria bacterium]
MLNQNTIELVLAKINVRAFAALGGLILIIGGIFMCMSGLSATGVIDLRSAIVEGKIETGSIGLMSMFLGVILMMVLNIKWRRSAGPEPIKISIEGDKIECEGFSHSKLAKVLETIDRGKNINPNYWKEESNKDIHDAANNER